MHDKIHPFSEKGGFSLSKNLKMSHPEQSEEPQKRFAVRFFDFCDFVTFAQNDVFFTFNPPFL